MIDRAFAGSKSIYARDADHDLDLAMRSTFGDLDLIKIARGVIVNGRPKQTAQVAHVTGCGNLRWMVSQLRQLLSYSWREVWLETMLQHDFFRGGLQIEVRRVGIVHESP